tara:strand:- start:457 stop:795 length:339 start_codon:yes stop_codon:yes gene_type:complete
MHKVGIFTKDIKLGTILSEQLVLSNRKFSFLESSNDLDETYGIAIIDLNENFFQNDIFIKNITFLEDLYVIGFMKKVLKKNNDYYKDMGCNMVISSTSIIKNIQSIIKEILR